jgi:N6-L-threonylcarbamoyladenine synthase
MATVHPPDLVMLGIETSCDETAAALVRREASGKGVILANLVRSQLALHAEFGGVVPEIAARAHVELLDLLVAEALAEAHLGWDEIDGVATTAGPGLIGGLIVGVTTGKAIALARRLPFIAVNHLEAHALTPGLTHGLGFPYLLLLVSGGHTQLLIVKDVGAYVRLGTTLDDALGEAFDKAAKLLGLSYPGGPAVEECAKRGRASIALPRPLLGRPEPHFSHAALKTALRHEAMKRTPPVSRTSPILRELSGAAADVVATARGGRWVYLDALGNDAQRASSPAARRQSAHPHGAHRPHREQGFTLIPPPPDLCTDNAAMVAGPAPSGSCAG